MDENRRPEEENPKPAFSSGAPYAPVHTAARKTKEKPRFEEKDWILLLVAALLGVYPALALSIRTLGSQDVFPGIGSALFFLAVIAAGIYAIGFENIKQKKGSIFVLAAAAVCAVSLALWSHEPLLVLNHAAAFVLAAIGLLAASGMKRMPLSRAGMLA